MLEAMHCALMTAVHALSDLHAAEVSHAETLQISNARAL